MAQVLVRNLEPTVVDRLKERAQRHHRSLEGEVRTILEDSVTFDLERFRRNARSLRERLADRSFPDLAELIAADRAARS